jgi:aldose 1-epimerase
MDVSSPMGVQRHDFGQLPGGRRIDRFVLTNTHGLKAALMNYGAILLSLEAPDRNGVNEDITLGYDALEGYFRNNTPYFGAIVGRVANRIAKGRFTLGGTEYRLSVNNGEHHLHGGTHGFDRVVWNAESVATRGSVGVKFSYLSGDGEEGYPGNLMCTVFYALTDTNELSIRYEAETDRDTPVNLSHHSYFNLGGPQVKDILRHELMINADHFTQVDGDLIPTGEIVPVRGTPMDFTVSTPVGSRIAHVRGGYDHNYVLRRGNVSLELAARVSEPGRGRSMEVFTTEPGLQFYSGNFLDGSIAGKSGRAYIRHAGFCLEAQHYPDTPNHDHFPSIVLRPGEKYRQTTVYRFSAS